MTIISEVQAGLSRELQAACGEYVKIMAQMVTLGATLKDCMSKETEALLLAMQQPKKNE